MVSSVREDSTTSNGNVSVRSWVDLGHLSQSTADDAEHTREIYNETKPEQKGGLSISFHVIIINRNVIK